MREKYLANIWPEQRLVPIWWLCFVCICQDRTEAS